MIREIIEKLDSINSSLQVLIQQNKVKETDTRTFHDKVMTRSCFPCTLHKALSLINFNNEDIIDVFVNGECYLRGVKFWFLKCCNTFNTINYNYDFNCVLDVRISICHNEIDIICREV